MSTFLLSWLSKQYGTLEESIFLREQPGEWLVLEADPGGAGRATEPLAIRVALRRDRARFTVGRDPASDLLVDDVSVALTHAVLEPDGDGVWTIRLASPETPARLDGLDLGDFPVALGSGARIDLAGKRLTFYSGADLHARLRAPS